MKIVLATLACAAALLAQGCVHTPPASKLNLDSPPPPPARKSEWVFASDLENVTAVATNAKAVWAIGPSGVLHWTRPGGAVTFEEARDAPHEDATAIALATDGTAYVGMRGGIAWKPPGPDGRWQRLIVPPLDAGVTALAPRRAGGVWVGLTHGFGWMHGGRLRLLNRTYSVRSLAVDDAGRVWAATARFGLITVMGDRILEHTTVEGMCANAVRSVATGERGAVAVLCEGATPSMALRLRNRWYAYSIKGGAVVHDVQWQTGGWILRTAGGWWRLLEQTGEAAPTPGAVTAPSPQMEPFSTRALAHAPDIISPMATQVAAVAQEGDAAAAAPAVPAPLPVVEDTLLVCARAEPAEAGNPADAPRYRLLDARPEVPDDVEIKLWHVEPDGFAWFGLAWRGLLAQKGSATQRYSSLSLVPRNARAGLVVDGQGRAWMPTQSHDLVQYDHGKWSRRPVAPPGTGAEALSAWPDASGRLWVLVGYPPQAIAPVVRQEDGTALVTEPTYEVALVRLEDERLMRLARLPVLGLDGALRTGQMHVAPNGEVVFPVFYDDAGQLRGAGLGVIPPAHDRVVRWLAQIGAVAPQVDDAPVLPDAWVNTVARAPDGTLYVGTNSGLVRVRGAERRVFNENDFIDNEVITALAVENNSSVVTGTLTGLGRLTGNTWKTLGGRLAKDTITALSIDGAGLLWVGTERGLFVQQGDDFVPVELRRGEAVRDVRAIVHDPQGGVWLLTGQGLYRRPPVAAK